MVCVFTAMMLERASEKDKYGPMVLNAQSADYLWVRHNTKFAAEDIFSIKPLTYNQYMTVTIREPIDLQTLASNWPNLYLEDKKTIAPDQGIITREKLNRLELRGPATNSQPASLEYRISSTSSSTSISYGNDSSVLSSVSTSFDTAHPVSSSASSVHREQPKQGEKQDQPHLDNEPESGSCNYSFLLDALYTTAAISGIALCVAAIVTAIVVASVPLSASLLAGGVVFGAVALGTFFYRCSMQNTEGQQQYNNELGNLDSQSSCS